MYSLPKHRELFLLLLFIILLLTLNPVITIIHAERLGESLAIINVFKPKYNVQVMDWHPSGKLIALAYETRYRDYLAVKDVDTYKTLWEFHTVDLVSGDSGANIEDLSWSPSGSYLAVAITEYWTQWSSLGPFESEEICSKPHLVILDEKGKVIFKQEYSRGYEFAEGVDWVDDNKVVFGTFKTIFMIDIQGKEIWRKKIEHPIECVSCSRSNRLIAIGCVDCVVILDSNGNIRWSYEVQGDVKVLAWSPDGERLIVASMGKSTGGVYAFSKDGRLLWRFSLSRELQGRPIHISWGLLGNYVLLIYGLKVELRNKDGKLIKVLYHVPYKTEKRKRYILDWIVGGALSPSKNKMVLILHNYSEGLRIYTLSIIGVPKAQFTVHGKFYLPKESIIFDASSSIDEDGRIVKYYWDFGDGSKGEGVRVEHAYLKPGKYRVKLVVIDDTGLASVMEKEITIYRPPELHISCNVLANVTIDNKPAIEVSYERIVTVTVTPGKHQIKASAWGFEKEVKEVTIGPGEVKTVSFWLKAKASLLIYIRTTSYVTVIQKGTGRVVVKDVKVEAGKSLFVGVEPGTYIIKAKALGIIPIIYDDTCIREVKVESDKLARAVVSYSLSWKAYTIAALISFLVLGRIYLKATEPKIGVVLTPQIILQGIPSTLKITITNSGLRKAKKKIRVKINGTVVLEEYVVVPGRGSITREINIIIDKNGLVHPLLQTDNIRSNM